MKNILPKLNKIQSELKAPKGQFNNFGKYKYRSCRGHLRKCEAFTSRNKMRPRGIGRTCANGRKILHKGNRHYLR